MVETRLQKEMRTLGAFICVRNIVLLDYCAELAAESLLKVVDELVIVDAESTDGTRQIFERMADKDSRIKVVSWPWPKPFRESHHWFLKWLDFGREQLTTDHYIYLDADEILLDTPECHAAIREAVDGNKCITVDRLNFWKDPQHLIPEGQCCGKWCTRIGPKDYECTSDEPRHAGELRIVDEATRDGRIQIFHMGFLRETGAMYRKSSVVLEAWFGRGDPRLTKAEQEGKPIWESECEWADQLVPYEGEIPLNIQRWLAARGHWTKDFVPSLPMPPIEKPKPAPIAVVEPGPGIVARSSGDGGDLVLMMAILAKWPGGPHTILLGHDGAGYGNCRTQGMLNQEHVFSSLALSQPYIKEVRRIQPGDHVDWVSEQFRQRYGRNQNLVQSLAMTDHVPMRIYGAKPWLSVDPMPGVSDRVIINRTNRWPGRDFPWRHIVEFYGKKILFIGTEEEHQHFCRGNDKHEAFGDVEYRATADFLTVARLIAGSALFIGNQSACMAICEGLKHRSIQEVCLENPDCIYQRENAQYCFDGAVVLEDFTTGERKVIGPNRNTNIPTHTCPPGDWQFKGISHHVFQGLMQRLEMNGIRATEEEVKLHNASRPDCAAFFYGQENARKYGRVYQSLRGAGYSI